MSASGSYLGFSASLEVDVKKFRESMTKETKFGESSYKLISGGDDLPEPIAIKLAPLDVGLKEVFYTSIDASSFTGNCSFTSSVLASKRTNIEKALKDYPKNVGAFKPKGAYWNKHIKHQGIQYSSCCELLRRILRYHSPNNPYLFSDIFI